MFCYSTCWQLDGKWVGVYIEYKVTFVRVVLNVKGGENRIDYYIRDEVQLIKKIHVDIKSLVLDKSIEISTQSIESFLHVLSSDKDLLKVIRNYVE